MMDMSDVHLPVSSVINTVVYLIKIYAEQNIQFQNFNMEDMTS